MKALIDFVGVIGGAELRFAAGQDISAKDAAEMGLAGKPDIATVAKAAKEAIVEDPKP